MNVLKYRQIIGYLRYTHIGTKITSLRTTNELNYIIENVQNTLSNTIMDTQNTTHN